VKYVLSPAARGTLNVTSKPSGSEVFLDGQFRGVTPLVIADVATGAHVLRVEKTNHDPWSGTALVRNAETVTASCELEDRVLAFLRGTVEENPRSILGYVELGHYYMVIGEPEKAAEVYARGRTLAKDPTLPKKDGKRLEKQIRKDMMWKGEAGERFRAAMRPSRAAYRPQVRDPAKAIAAALKEEKAGRAATGAAIVERALKHNANNVQLLEQRARLRLVAGDNARAIAAINEAFRRTGRDIGVRMRLGAACLESLRRFDAARRKAMCALCAYQLAAARTGSRTQRIDSGRILARLYVEAHRGDEAVDVFTELMAEQKVPTTRSRLQLELCELLVSLGRVDEARTRLDELLSRSADPNVHRMARAIRRKLDADKAR
jgi:tetratricopeptide (TPR) repeat protein